MEDKINTEVMDKLDLLIADRLGERDRKMKRIEEWNAPKKGVKTVYVAISILSVAACLAIVFFAANPWENNLGDSNMSQWKVSLDMNSFRSADPSKKRIMELMDKEKYEEALRECKDMIVQSDMKLQQQTSNNLGVIDEEQEYENELLTAENEEIRWVYIYLLVKTNEATEALEQLNRYIEGSWAGEHMDEAVALREKIIKMKKY